jgi:hypothetical protein
MYYFKHSSFNEKKAHYYSIFVDEIVAGYPFSEM